MDKIYRIIAIIFILIACSGYAFAENTHSVDFSANSSQYLSISDSEQIGLGLNSSFTIEAWIYLHNTPSSSGINMTILSKDAFGSNRSYFFHIVQSTNQVGLGIFGDDGSFRRYFMDDSITTNDINKWIHLAVSFNLSNGEMIFYKNGAPKTGAISSNGQINNIKNSISPFCIGGLSDPAVQILNGKVDEVRVWDVIRTPQQITDNYNKELIGNEPGLVGYWKFNESLNDLSGNNNNLTNNNGTTFSTDVPFSGDIIPPEPSTCSCIGEDIDTESANEIFGAETHQQLRLGLLSDNTPNVCIIDVPSCDFINEYSFFDSTFSPSSVSYIPGTDNISVTASDNQTGIKYLEILDISSNTRTRHELP